jgi:hypothetical protein
VLRSLSAVALALVCASPALPTAATSVPTFAEMRWGATQAQVLDAARAADLTVVSTGAGDIELSGEPYGVPAVVHARMSPESGLVKVEVRFTATETPAQTYATVKERLTELYGPTEPVELYKRPFVRGDGRENEAVLTGKAVLIAAWGDEREPGQAAVIVQAIRPGVLLDFESHGWKAEAVRRERQSPTQRRAPAGPPQMAD